MWACAGVWSSWSGPLDPAAPATLAAPGREPTGALVRGDGTDWGRRCAIIDARDAEPPPSAKPAALASAHPARGAPVAASRPACFGAATNGAATNGTATKGNATRTARFGTAAFSPAPNGAARAATAPRAARRGA
ncbi:MAG: hypothetical protein ABIQ73_12245 [Acidimicrobiales bacterium]